MTLYVTVGLTPEITVSKNFNKNHRDRHLGIPYDADMQNCWQS